MKFTLSWLKKFLDTDASLDQITHKLTMIGLEIEDVIDQSENFKDFEVAKIIETSPHPDADKLQICRVKTKDGILQIVCGAKNARSGIKVVLAKIGSIIPNGNFKIKKSAIRGVESNGMLCASDELGIAGSSDGIMELPSHAIIGDNFAKYCGLDDPIIDINITPNRGDALGVYGIARDLAASGIGKLRDLEIPILQESFQTNCKIEVKDSDACSIFTITEIRNLKNCESPEWLKNFLENIGVGSISAIVDITNYIAYSFGRPMHAYDADKISGNFKIEKLSKEVEFNALNDKEYKLQSGDLVIGDSKSVHCLAGIIGGNESACSENTTRIFLEAAVFDADQIAKTGRNLMIDTDSRYRFERNVDAEITHDIQKIAVDLILSICGGEASNITQSNQYETKKRYIDFPMGFLESRANISLDRKEMINILESLGFLCKIENDIINIEIPSWRHDVVIKEDIVEEFVRIYGYDKLPETPLPFSNMEKIIPADQKRISDIKRLVANNGYDEIVTWSFMDSKKAKLFYPLKNELILKNPISADLDYMRPSILPNILKAAHNNINRSFSDLALFEVGPVFENTGDHIINIVSGIRVGNNIKKNSHSIARSVDIFDIKSDIATILEYSGLDIDKCQINDDAPKYYHPTRSASISLGRKTLGYFGQIHPSILKEFGIDEDVVAFEINISNLPIGKPKYGKKPDFISSNYQMIKRDYAFIVDKNQRVGELISFIKNTDKKLVKSVSLFDIYSGKNIESGKKSIAISVNIQDDNKTLEENDIDILNKSIIDGISKKFSGILRDG